MLSPDGQHGARAPSIWSCDSGYESQEQAARRRNVSPANGEPAFEPLVAQLAFFTTKDASPPFGTSLVLPELEEASRVCLTCEFLQITTMDADVKCDDCLLPDTIEPSALHLDQNATRPLSVHGTSESERPVEPSVTIGTRCSACELSALIDPTGVPTCSSCSPTSELLSPISPTESSGQVKRSRAGRNAKLPLSALNRLQSWLDSHKDHPYPSSAEKRALAQECGLTEKQVTTWFTNARARQLSPLETYLSSASEDEAANEEDIASAASTHNYNPFSSAVSELNTTGYRQPMSVSGSSAFSATQKHAQSSRRGKKKIYRRSNQPTPITEQPNVQQLSQFNADASEHETTTWQCTFCRRHVAPKSWRRHEETQHRPKAQWTCMLFGPRLSFPHRGGSCCAFCMAKDPSESHFLDAHRITECAKRPVGERTFFRPDHLRQHVKNFHGATLFDVAQGRWKREAEAECEDEMWTCGFCGEGLESWGKRETHIAEHFKDGWRMDMWRDELGKNRKERERIKTVEKREKENERERESDHPSAFTRLTRSLTRRSTGSSSLKNSSRSQQQPQQQQQQHQPQHQHQHQPHQQPQPHPFPTYPNTYTSLPIPIPMPPSFPAPAPAPTPSLLPNINIDALMDSSQFNQFVDWTAVSMQEPQFPQDGLVFDQGLQTDFTGAFGVGGLDYEGGGAGGAEWKWKWGQ